MTSASSPEPTPDLQPELQPKPQKPAPELEFEEVETALPPLDVIPHPAPVTAPVATAPLEEEVVEEVAAPEELVTPAPADAPAPEADTTSLTDKLLVSFFKLWTKAVGEPADPNRAIIGLSVLSLTTLIVLSRIYGFIDQLPVLAPIFELVGFFYSISVVIRYIRSEEDRSDLGKTVEDLKKKLLG